MTAITIATAALAAVFFATGIGREDYPAPGAAGAHPETARIDRNWLSAEINSPAQWEIIPARRVRERVYEATATASVRIDLPHRPGMTADARVPWNLRIHPDHQGIEANRLRKKHGNTTITQPVAAPTVGTGIPQARWGNAGRPTPRHPGRAPRHISAPPAPGLHSFQEQREGACCP